MDIAKVERCIEALQDDCARQSGVLTVPDIARVIDRRALEPDEAAEVWLRVEHLGLVAASEIEEPSADSGADSAKVSSVPSDVDLLDLFIRDIRGARLLSDREIVSLSHVVRLGTLAEEAVVAGTAREGDVHTAIEAGRAARNRFVEANIRLVIYFARQYFGASGATDLDAIQDGVMGLMKAVERFEPDRGYRFGTYAMWWIRQYMQRGREGRPLVRVPAYISERLQRLRRKTRRLRVELGREPSVVEIARELDLDPGHVSFLQQVDQSPVSLDDTVAGSDDVTVGDSLRDPHSPDPEQRLAREEMQALISENLRTLPPRDRAIVERRFGLVTGEAATLQEVADEFGLTRERIRQIVEKAVEGFRRQRAWKELM